MTGCYGVSCEWDDGTSGGHALESFERDPWFAVAVAWRLAGELGCCAWWRVDVYSCEDTDAARAAMQDGWPEYDGDVLHVDSDMGGNR